MNKHNKNQHKTTRALLSDRTSGNKEECEQDEHHIYEDNAEKSAELNSKSEEDRIAQEPDDAGQQSEREEKYPAQEIAAEPASANEEKHPAQEVGDTGDSVDEAGEREAEQDEDKTQKLKIERGALESNDEEDTKHNEAKSINTEVVPGDHDEHRVEDAGKVMNNDHDGYRAEDDGEIVIGNHNGHTIVDNGRERTAGRLLVPVLPTRPISEFPPLTPQQLAVRRARINRILLLKRRRRSESKLASRLMIAFVVLLILLVSFVSGGVGTAYAYYQEQLPTLNGIAQHTLFQTTRIYDRNGTLLYQLYDHQQDKGRRTYVDYKDISPLLVNATVAAEDRTFWNNSGVDPQGIVRAAVEYLQTRSVQGGGSTITQQLIKKLTGNDQVTLNRKITEATLAIGLTQQYPKWKIMEMYLNTVYYGDINYGAEAAAQDYFGLTPQCTASHCKPAVAQLDLAQASMLAGLPQSPTFYNPIVNKSAALDRQMIVLNAMYQQGMITQKQVVQAHNEMAKYTFKSYAAEQTMQAPHFVRYVIDQVLVPLLGAQNLVDGGYNIYTTLDLGLEKKVEQIVYDHLYKAQQDSYFGYYGPLNITNNVNNAAAVVMNPFNGEILAMDGSANYNQNDPQMQGQYNAALALRQPGSSFKPIVYATAFEMGWYPAMIVPDHKTIYPTKVANGYYTPQNYDGKFHTGYPMTIRTAIANSFNIPAIDTIEFTGIPNVLNMAARLGLSEVASRPLKDLGPSLAIGGAEVSLLHLTGAYATFANQGVRVPQTSILEITDNQGHPIYKYDEQHPRGERALGADVAFLISSMLSDKASRYHEFFPGNPLELADRPAAAKTGTTDSFRDNWTMGYTPYLTVGVWAGNSDNSIMQNVIGITGAGPTWHDIMEFASQRYHYPPDDFIRPRDVHAGTVSALTGLLPRPGEPTVTDWFIDGTMPTIQGSYAYYGPVCQGDRCKGRPCHGDTCNGIPPIGTLPVIPPIGPVIP